MEAWSSQSSMVHQELLLGVLPGTSAAASSITAQGYPCLRTGRDRQGATLQASAHGARPELVSSSQREADCLQASPAEQLGPQ